MVLKPEPVDPVRLHDVRDWVREGCEVVRKRSRATWRTEDIYTALRAGTSTLFLIEDAGFIVLQMSVEPRGPTLFVWVIFGALKEYEQDMYAWLRDFRDRGGFRAVWWLSPRRWDARPGVRLVQNVYELE